MASPPAGRESRCRQPQCSPGSCAVLPRAASVRAAARRPWLALTAYVHHALARQVKLIELLGKAGVGVLVVGSEVVAPKENSGVGQRRVAGRIRPKPNRNQPIIQMLILTTASTFPKLPPFPNPNSSRNKCLPECGHDPIGMSSNNVTIIKIIVKTCKSQ